MAKQHSRLPESRWVVDDVFMMTWYDEVDHAVATHGLELIKAATKEKAPKYVLIDATEMTGYKMNVREAAIGCLRELKSCGMERMFAVMPGSAIRMFLSAIAMVVGARVEFLADRKSAEAALGHRGVRLKL
jgi:hypothetical protein